MKAEAGPLPATYAAVVLKSSDLDPDTVSAIFSTKPTLSYRKGDPFTVRDMPHERRFGIWVFSTRNAVKSDSLKVHLDVIEELLIGSKSAWPDSRLSKLHQLVSAQKAELRVDVFWYGAEGTTFPKISRSFEQVVTMAGGVVATDFHRDGEATDALDHAVA